MHDLGRGDNFERDLKLTPLAARLKLIFDVGANIGQSALRLAKDFPASSIVCFEPVSSTFKQLKSNILGNTRIRAENIGLGLPGETRAAIQSVALSTDNRIVSSEAPVGGTEQVEITWGDKYCVKYGIQSVDFLKIDTEGYDFNVLKGFSSMIGAAKISLIEVELGMNRNNKKHVYYHDVVNFLDQYGYDVFGIYEQIREFHGRLPLRRANFVFLHRGLLPH